MRPGDEVVVMFTPDCPSWMGFDCPTRGIVVGLNGDCVDVQIGDDVEPVDVEMVSDVRSADVERAEIDEMIADDETD